MTTMLGVHGLRRKRMIAPRDAARDLQIDDARSVTRLRRTTSRMTNVERCERHRHRRSAIRCSERCKRVMCRGTSTRLPAAHFADLIDAVGKLIAAILDIDAGIAQIGTYGR